MGFVLGTRLRKFFWYAVTAGLITAGYTFAYAETIFAFLIAPADGILSPHEGRLVVTGLTSSFGATVSLAFKGFFLGFIPVFLVGVLGLFKRAIPYRWWVYVNLFLLLSVVAFVSGLAFFYYVILPVMITFLLQWNQSVAQPLIEMNEYMAEITQLGLAIGGMFTLPIVIFLAAKANIVTYHQLATKRKYIILGLLTFAVFITPSLEGTLTFMVFTPMYALFEVGVFVAWLSHRSGGNYFTDYFIYQWLRDLLLWLLSLPVALAMLPARAAGRLYRRLKWWG
jgi:sec-independent protein translocase protein TatC